MIFERFSIDCLSYSPPIYTEHVIAEAFILIASSIDAVIISLESSFNMLCPPETLKTTGLSASGGIQVLKAPLVIINASAYGNKGSTVLPRFRKQVVGP